ncbi:acyl-CoA dehydrogenase family protein [Falsiroseomonas sp. E2-1-a4]|uniref:acyl-CoA dehydrogenase family protein n=1 Tax=Falsiroseomonas sp. E2-1-a4 TaxID=3239299 RepID=UPI003F30CA53
MHAQEAETVALLLDRVRALARMVAECREAIEQERRLPAPLFGALAEAGLFRLWLPRALGGPEVSPFSFMEVVEAAAALDASVGWVVGNGGGASRIAGYLEPDAAHGLFGDPRAFMVTATGAVGQAVPVEGGFRVSGRWPFGSGIHGATAVTGLCAVEQRGREGLAPMIMCCAPIGAARVIDNWHVSGLRGTGSCDWVMEDVFVPAELAFGFPDQRATQPGVVYRMPVISSFSWSVAVVPLALARAALDDFVAVARDKVRVGTSQPLREREVIQSDVGRADALLRAGRALLVEAMQALVVALERGETEVFPLRIGLRQAAAHAAETALRVAGMLEGMAGSAAILEAGRLPRQLRDLRASVQHVAMSPHNFITAGRLAMGLDLGTTRV